MAPVRGFRLGPAGVVLVLATAFSVGQAVSPGTETARRPRVVAPRSGGEPVVTLNKEVVRMLQANCQKCHRDGGIGPFPLVSYADAYSHRSDILSNTTERKMPPWHVNSACNSYDADPSLSSADISTLTKWILSGAPEGN